MDFNQLLEDATLIRNGQLLRGDALLLRMLHMMLFLLLRDGGTRLSISLANEEDTQAHYVINGVASELVPPPAYRVENLYSLLAVEPEPWYRRLWSRLRHEPQPRVRPCWQGQIELRIRGLVIPIHCDFLAYPGGLFLVFELAVTAEDLARIGSPLNQST
jgi:hypothetical protein